MANPRTRRIGDAENPYIVPDDETAGSGRMVGGEGTYAGPMSAFGVEGPESANVTTQQQQRGMPPGTDSAMDYKRQRSEARERNRDPALRQNPNRMTNSDSVQSALPKELEVPDEKEMQPRLDRQNAELDETIRDLYSSPGSPFREMRDSADSRRRIRRK